MVMNYPMTLSNSYEIMEHPNKRAIIKFYRKKMRS